MKIPKKIPILWRIEKFFKTMANNVEEEKKMDKGYKDDMPYGMVRDPRHQRSNGTCEKCGNHKFFRRKNNIKCTKCGNKQAK